MRTTPSKIVSLLTTVMALILLAVAPVAAEHGSSTSGSGGSGGTNTTTTSEIKSTSGPTSPTSPTKTETNTQSEGAVEPIESKVIDKVQTIKTQGAEFLAEQRKNDQTHSTTDRQKSCLAHQTEINSKITNFSKQAQNHLDVFNKIFARVQASQATKNVTVLNWDTLIAAATSKQTDATNAVAALKSLSVNVDCTAVDPAASLSSVKSAADAARTSLQAYRSAIKDVIVALGKAIDQSSSSNNTTSKTTTTTGGN